MGIGHLAYKLSIDNRDFNKGMTLTKRGLSEARKIMEASKTPAQRLEDRQRRLFMLYKAGAIDLRAYNREMTIARQKHDEVAAAATRNATAQQRLATSQRTAMTTGKAQAGMMTAISGKAASSAKALGAYALAYVGVSKSIGLVTSQAAEMDEITKLSDRTGASTEAIVGFGRAAEISGSSADKMRSAIDVLQKRLGEASRGRGAGVDRSTW